MFFTDVDKFDDPKRGTLLNDSTYAKALGTGGAFQAHANQLRMGLREVTSCKLSKLKLMRSTSAHLSQHSSIGPQFEHSDTSKVDSLKNNDRYRLGLNIGFDGTENAKGEGITEYVLGGWCVGTVLDSAASRATVHTGVRTAPNSMALNVDVNVEWWSGDKLYRHYMDVQSGGAGGGSIGARDRPSGKPPDESADVDPKEAAKGMDTTTGGDGEKAVTAYF